MFKYSVIVIIIGNWRYIYNYYFLKRKNKYILDILIFGYVYIF